MTAADLEKNFDAFVAKQKEIMFSKSQDYSRTEDRLSNFKSTSVIVGQSPEQVCLALIGTKISRLGSLMRDGRTPQHESVSDTLLDLCNYSVLLSALIKEKGETPRG